jgi:DNA-binding CsgD family transcriptional regulator
VGRESELSEALGAFRPFFDARGVSYFTVADMRHPESSHMGSAGVSEASLLEYHSHFSVHDEWVLAAYRRPDLGVGSVFRGTDLVDRKSLRQSYFWKEFLSRHGVIDSVSVVVEMAFAEGPTTYLTFHRHTGQRPFAPREARLLKTLAPHFRNVLRLHRRLAPALALGSTLAEIVQRLDLPVLFVTPEAAVASANPAATTELARPDGWLQQQGGRLLARTVTGWTPLADAVAGLQASAHGSSTLDLVDDTRRAATLELRAVPGARTDHIAQHRAVAVATLRSGPRDKARALREIHGLTPAETRVALQIAEGRSAAAIAEQSGLAITTLRTHIAATLAKLGLGRQAELVAFVARL